jgi:tripartite-type tricarboxylate transporter receptor subunit TctC
MSVVLAIVIVVAIAVGAGVYLVTRPVAVVEEYPTKAITLICPWAAGGGTDRISRYLADKLSAELGQPVVVVNKTGGNGAVGHVAGATAPADGYTLTMVTIEIATMHHLGYTTVGPANFRGVIQINEDPAGVIVRPDAPWKDVVELFDYMKTHPGLKFSGSGTGTIWHTSLIGACLKDNVPVANFDWIPSSGAAPSITELLGGHVDVITCSIAEAGAQLDAGTLKALAVMSDERLSRFPNVPTLKEKGIDWSSGTWRGIGVPAGTPDAIVTKLHDAIKKIIETDDWKNWMAQQGFGMAYRGMENFDKFMVETDFNMTSILAYV